MNLFGVHYCVICCVVETKSIHQNKAEQMRFLIKMILASFLFRKCQEPLRRETTKSSSIEFIGSDATAQEKWLDSLIHKCFFFLSRTFFCF